MSRLKGTMFVILVAALTVIAPFTAAQGVSTKELLSPRLVALQKELQAGNRAALESFWQQIAKQGTPLVEPVAGDDKSVLVTFLWRGDSETHNVVLFSALPGCGADAAGYFSEAQFQCSRLANLPGTNVWFKTYKLPKNPHFSYYLSPNDSLAPSDQRKEKDWDTLQPDPLNPHRFVKHEEDRDWVKSVMEAPGEAHESWGEERSNVPKGRTEEFYMSSKVLGDERLFWIYTPPGYSQTSKPYALLVLFDGWAFAHSIPTATMLDNLLAANRIPPIVVLLVGQKNRMAELTCNDSFDDFLVRELVPWTRAHYHVTSNPAETTIAGGSAGGLGAAFAGLRHPEVFGNVLSLFGYFAWEPGEHKVGGDAEGGLGEWEWIIHQYAETPKVPLRFVIIAGLFDYGGELSPRPAMLASNRHMRDVLLAKGYPVIYREIAAGDDTFSALFALPDGLRLAIGRQGTQQ
jgi:enterochelin esterase-like enzyme